jgi:hypothetical protein
MLRMTGHRFSSIQNGVRNEEIILLGMDPQCLSLTENERSLWRIRTCLEREGVREKTDQVSFIAQEYCHNDREVSREHGVVKQRVSMMAFDSRSEWSTDIVHPQE